MNPTSTIDSADWLLAIPVQQPAGQTLDFSGTKLSAALTPVFGGDPIQEVSSDTGDLTFVPGAKPYFALNLRVKDRTWRVSRVTTIFADIKRNPDLANPQFVEWLGRITLRVHPGSDSSGIAAAATSPVLIPVQPYEGRLASEPMIIGPQGSVGPTGDVTPEAQAAQAAAETASVAAQAAREGITSLLIQMATSLAVSSASQIRILTRN